MRDARDGGGAENGDDEAGEVGTAELAAVVAERLRAILAALRSGPDGAVVVAAEVARHVEQAERAARELRDALAREEAELREEAEREEAAHARREAVLRALAEQAGAAGGGAVPAEEALRAVAARVGTAAALLRASLGPPRHGVRVTLPDPSGLAREMEDWRGLMERVLRARPAPVPVDWRAAVDAAAEKVRGDFRRGAVPLAMVRQAVDTLATGAKQRVAGLAAEGDTAAPDAAEGVALAEALLRQSCAQLDGFAGRLARAERARCKHLAALVAARDETPDGPRPAGEKRDEAGPFDAAVFDAVERETGATAAVFALEAAHDLARGFADAPGETFVALLHALVPKKARAEARSARATKRGLVICAMEAMAQAARAARPAGAKAPNGEARNRAASVAQDCGETPECVAKWHYDHRARLRAMADAGPEGWRENGDTTRTLLSRFAARYLALGAPQRPTDAAAWERVADAYRARLRAMAGQVAPRPETPAGRSQTGRRTGATRTGT